MLHKNRRPEAVFIVWTFHFDLTQKKINEEFLFIKIL